MITQKKIAVANWKTNPKTPEEASKLFKALSKKATAVKGVETVICAPTLYSNIFLKEKRNPKIRFGAQNVFHKAEGSATGEVSVAMLKASKISHVIVGHSERRALGETDALVAQKASILVNQGCTPIVCIGEAVHDPEGNYLTFLANQITSSLSLVPKTQLLDVVIAYEPIWAIGASQAMSGHDIHGTTLYIRKVLRDLYNQTIADGLPILYGGAVNSGNIKEIVEEGNIDGVLVGRDSLNPESFGDILTVLAQKSGGRSVTKSTSKIGA